MIRERLYRGALVSLIAVVLSAIAATAASALVVQLPSGQRLGVMLRPGAPASATSTLRAYAVTRSSAFGPLISNSGPNDLVNTGGGPVLGSSAPYLIFWDPTTNVPSQSTGSVSSQSQALMERYFIDVAHDGAGSNDAYGVLKQYGSSALSSVFTGAHAIVDTDAYPTRGPNCPLSTGITTSCVTDTQVETELTGLISSDSLPNNGPTSKLSSFPADAPIYFIVLPETTDECMAAQQCSYTRTETSAPITTT